MQVTVEEISAVKKKIRVEIPPDQVSKELDDAYHKLKKSARIKGYRPGKTPRSVLERHFKKDVHADVISNLVQSTFPEAVKETELDIINTSDIDTPELDPEASFIYNATVELKPDLPEVDFKGIELRKTDYKVDRAEIDNQVEMLRKHLAEYKPAEDRPAAEGDYVTIRYEGFRDGQPYEPTALNEDYAFKLGNSGFTGQFDEQIAGMAAGGEKEITVNFPEDHSNPDLSGQEINFKIGLKEIRQEILPPADDELAKKLGKFDSMEELRAEIEKNLLEGYEKRSQQEIQEQIFEKLLPEDFEVPEVLVGYELDDIIADTARRFADSGVSMDQLGMTREMMEQQYRGIAEKQVRRHLLLGKIIDQENLEVPDEQFDSELEKISEATGQPVDAIKSFYRQNPEKQDAFKHAILEKSAIDLIISQAHVETVAPEDTKSSENLAETE